MYCDTVVALNFLARTVDCYIDLDSLQMTRSKVLHDTQVLPTRLALRIKVRDFANTDGTVSTARSEALVVTCRGVEDTAVVPNC